jgi:hypothetical protein
MREFEPGFWAAVVAIASAVLGWWGRGARESERLENLRAELARLDARMEGRVKSLETGSVQTAAALATITAELQSIGRTLARLDVKLDQKADKA